MRDIKFPIFIPGSKGAAVGIREGWEGKEVGEGIGCFEGSSEGIGEGLKVGLFVGDLDGKLEGEVVGDLVRGLDKPFRQKSGFVSPKVFSSGRTQ